MAYVYRHIRLDTNTPFYIGVGSDKTYFRAMQKSKNKRSVYWQNVIAKTDYEVEIIIDNVSVEESLVKEIEFIKLYGRADQGTGTLVNLTDGGEKPPVLVGDNNPAKRPAVRKILSEQRIGIKLSEDHKRKLSQSKISAGVIPPSQKGIKRSAESINKMIASVLRNGKRRKQIYQYSATGVLINKWDYAKSIKAAYPKYSIGNIHMVCRGERNVAYGYVWRFI